LKKEVVIIGGGIIGLCSAFYLQKEGHQVSIVEKSNLNSGASFVNAGFISPSHVVPLAAPGMVAMGAKMMFNSASPFYLKPRLNVNLLKWAWAFNKSATAKHVKKAAPIIKELTVFSRELFQEFKNNQLFNFHFEKKGLLMAYQTLKFEKKEAELAKIAKTQGLEVTHINKAKLKEMEPEIKAEGAYYYMCDAHSTPNEFMQKMILYLKSKGVIFYANETVLSIKNNVNDTQSLTTNKRTLTFDELVIAAGAWTPALVKKLGIKLLVEAGKGYSINVFRNTGIKYPAILAERNTAITPMDGFTRFGGTMEIGGINSKINKKRVQQIAENVKAFYPNVHIMQEEQDKAACGLRPLSPDGLPFIGRSKYFKNVTIATGHAMMGWSQGPATGKLISEIITDNKTSINLTPFSLERFN
jgi:D-amino-acid dehydrogenase